MKWIYKSLIMLSVVVLLMQCALDDEDIATPELREEFVGEWTANDDCSKMYYRVRIGLDDDNSVRVMIDNFANLGIEVPAVVGGTSIYIDAIKVDNYTINANGKLNGKTITWSSYGYETSAVITECTAVFTKQEE